MKQMNSLKAAFGWMLIAFVSVLTCVSFTACGKDDVTGHDNSGNAVMSVKAEKRDTTPTPVYSDSSWVTVDNTVINLWWEYLRNDTVIQKDSVKCNFTAQMTRKEDKLETNTTRLNNLGITEGQIVESRDGKNNYVYRQEFKDLDGQTYNGLFTSGYATLKNLTNVHAKLKGFRFLGFRNIPQETPADMDTLVITRTGWAAVYEIEPGANLAGKQFELALDSVDHFRYIKKNAPTLLYSEPFKHKYLGVWNCGWTIGKYYYWSNNTVTADSMSVNLKASYETIELKDKVVNNLENYSHDAGSLKFKERTAAQSNDARVKKYDNTYEKKSYATNGFESDQFYTLFTLTVQDAIVEFCDSTWTIEAEDVAMTTTRNVFADEDSDRDGYQMVRFTDTESAKYADGKGENTVALKESCKLYMKVATPAELDKIEFIGTKIHANNKVSIDGSVIPVFTDGSKGAAIEFKWSKAESWYWKNDSVIAEGVTFVNQTTGELKLKGDVKESKKTFATDNDEVTIECTQFDADFELPVTVDGVKKLTTWHATWYENFYVVYQGKKVSLTKSNYNVKNQNDKLTKDEAKSSATQEVWGYSVEGLFSIDDDARSAMGYGRLTKAIDEEVITEYWEKFNFETDAHEYTDRVEYFLKWIREYNTGKKTSQEVKIVLKRNAEGSAYTITVDDPQREIGSQSESSSILARTETASDIIINYDWKTSVFELPNYFDGSTITENDVCTFVDPTNVKVTKKNSKGEDVTIDLPSFEHELTSTVSELEKVSESDELVEYTYTRTWNWASTQCTSTVKSIGEINTLKSTPVNPDFDIEIGSIYATVSRPSNRDAADITAYTYLLVSKDGKKCLPLGIYHDVVTVGEITNMQEGFNSACYVKNENKVVATTATLKNGIIKYKDANGNLIDGGTFLQWQGSGFNDRGNDFINHTGKYAPHAKKDGNVYVVTFEGTNVSYTFKGWDVK